jgi:hydrogenase maturation protease
MAQVLIIGLGNPLRGDDGLGWHAVQQLRKTLPLENVEMITCHQLTPELAEAMARSKRVIFIDAAVGEPPGEINLGQLNLGKINPTSMPPPVFSHRLDPLGLMQYSRELYGTWPEAFTVSLNGQAYGYAEKLSDPVQSSLSAVLQLVEDLASSLH